MANTKAHKPLKLNLIKLFNKESKTLIKTYKTLLTKKQGVKIDKAPSNKLSTIQRKGRDHWLKDTNETYNNVFKRSVGRVSFIVFSSDSNHSGKRTYMGVKGGHVGKRRGVRRPRDQKRIVQSKQRPSYSQIMDWHNQEGYSGIFGGMWPVGSKAPQRINKEIKRQSKKHFHAQISRTIYLKMGGK